MADKKSTEERNDETMAKVDKAEADAERDAVEKYRLRDEKRQAYEEKRMENHLREMEVSAAHNAKVQARDEEHWKMQVEGHSFRMQGLAIDKERNELWKADREDTAKRWESYERRLAQQGEALMALAQAVAKMAENGAGR